MAGWAGLAGWLTGKKEEEGPVYRVKWKKEFFFLNYYYIAAFPFLLPSVSLLLPFMLHGH